MKIVNLFFHSDSWWHHKTATCTFIQFHLMAENANLLRSTVSSTSSADFIKILNFSHTCRFKEHRPAINAEPTTIAAATSDTCSPSRIDANKCSQHSIVNSKVIGRRLMELFVNFYLELLFFFWAPVMSFSDQNSAKFATTIFYHSNRDMWDERFCSQARNRRSIVLIHFIQFS